MPVFVHLTSHRNLPAIRRSGLRSPRRGQALHAMPVTRNFHISHQWLRELRRGGRGTIVGVYFRLPDEELVEIGHYDGLRVAMPAAQAAALMLDAETRDPAPARGQDERSRAVQRRRALPSSPEGYEVLVSGPIHPSRIVRVKVLPQVVGWRYRPGSNGRPPCLCLCCERGRYGLRKLAGKVAEAEAAGRTAPATLFGRDERSFERAVRIAERRQRR